MNRINAIDQTTFYPGKTYCKHKESINEKYQSLQELLDDCNLYHSLTYIPLLDASKIDVDVLKAFLKKYNREDIYTGRFCTDIKRVICLYDYLKYKLLAGQAVQFLGSVDESSQEVLVQPL